MYCMAMYTSSSILKIYHILHFLVRKNACIVSQQVASKILQLFAKIHKTSLLGMC